jgi:hypothetical protein
MQQYIGYAGKLGYISRKILTTYEGTPITMKIIQNIQNAFWKCFIKSGKLKMPWIYKRKRLKEETWIPVKNVIYTKLIRKD